MQSIIYDVSGSLGHFHAGGIQPELLSEDEERGHSSTGGTNLCTRTGGVFGSAVKDRRADRSG